MFIFIATSHVMIHVNIPYRWLCDWSSHAKHGRLTA